MLNKNPTSSVPRIFGALSDETRFAIVERLMAEGELPAGEIGSGFDISAPAISRHLNVLNDAGVVQKRTSGQQRLYSVRPQAIEQVCAWAISHREFWEASLTRLEAALMKETTRK